MGVDDEIRARRMIEGGKTTYNVEETGGDFKRRIDARSSRSCGRSSRVCFFKGELKNHDLPQWLEPFSSQTSCKFLTKKTIEVREPFALASTSPQANVFACVQVKRASRFSSGQKLQQPSEQRMLRRFPTVLASKTIIPALRNSIPALRQALPTPVYQKSLPKPTVVPALPAEYESTEELYFDTPETYHNRFDKVDMSRLPQPFRPHIPAIHAYDLECYMSTEELYFDSRETYSNHFEAVEMCRLPHPYKSHIPATHAYHPEFYMSTEELYFDSTRETYHNHHFDAPAWFPQSHRPLGLVRLDMPLTADPVLEFYMSTEELYFESSETHNNKFDAPEMCRPPKPVKLKAEATDEVEDGECWMDEVRD
eukprot:g20201.t1